MKLIQRLAEMIDEEIDDAKKYALCYQQYKDEDPELAKTFSQLGFEELTHVDRLHAQVVRIIKKYRDDHGDPPANMQARYDYLHELSTRKAEVRLLLA